MVSVLFLTSSDVQYMRGEKNVTKRAIFFISDMQHSQFCLDFDVSTV